jgi:hypothetical protein
MNRVYGVVHGVPAGPITSLRSQGMVWSSRDCSSREPHCSKSNGLLDSNQIFFENGFRCLLAVSWLIFEINFEPNKKLADLDSCYILGMVGDESWTLVLIQAL